MTRVHVLAPTLLEYLVARRAIRDARLQWAGMRLARWQGAPDGSIVVICGLAGALVPDLRPGAILIPEQVGLMDGRTLRCDDALVAALRAAARRMGYEPVGGPLLTAPSLVVGGAREQWARRGFVAADMETGLLAGRNLRVATVRVVLDSPEHEISPAWAAPARAVLATPAPPAHRRPGSLPGSGYVARWRELFWLGRVAPRYARRAARVLNGGLSAFPQDSTCVET